jgi:hypothetical protein
MSGEALAPPEGEAPTKEELGAPEPQVTLRHLELRRVGRETMHGPSLAPVGFENVLRKIIPIPKDPILDGEDRPRSLLSSGRAP